MMLVVINANPGHAFVIGTEEPAQPADGSADEPEELSDPARVREIKERHEKAMATKKKRRVNLPLVEVLDEVLEDEDDDQPCFFCHS